MEKSPTRKSVINVRVCRICKCYFSNSAGFGFLPHLSPKLAMEILLLLKPFFKGDATLTIGKTSRRFHCKVCTQVLKEINRAREIPSTERATTPNNFMGVKYNGLSVSMGPRQKPKGYYSSHQS